MHQSCFEFDAMLVNSDCMTNVMGSSEDGNSFGDLANGAV
jgi:hypothetical protein